MKFRSIALAAATVALSLLVALILGEILLRAVGIQSSLVYMPNSMYGWGHTAGSEFVWRADDIVQNIRINSNGLRDIERAYAKPDQTYRVLALGDSFTEAFQVAAEQSFPKIIEKLLNRNNPGGFLNYEVINAGVAGYGTDNELLFFENEGYKYEPDLVLLALYIGNDIRNNWFPLENIDTGGFRKPYYVPSSDGLQLMSFPFVEHDSFVTRAKLFLNRNLVMYGFLREIRDRFRARTGGGGNGDRIPLDFGLFAPDYSQDWLTAWSVTAQLLRKLRQQVAARGAKLVVMLIPTHFQVDKPGWDRLADRPALHSRVWDFEKPNRLLVEQLEADGVDYIDLLPLLRTAAAADNAEFYLPADGHWTAEGHRVVAIHVAERLADFIKTPSHEQVSAN